MENVIVALEKIHGESTKIKIFTCLMEYAFLKDCSFNYLDDYSEFFDEFDIGAKTQKAVKEQILNINNLRGENGFINKYRSESYQDFSDEFFLDFEGDEKEEIVLNDILHISSGEEKKLRNKSITFMNFVNVEGSLIFENCDIYFSDKYFSKSPIVLNKSAKLRMSECRFYCKISDKKMDKWGSEDSEQQKYFIDVMVDNCFAEFENCIFEECAYFFRTTSETKIKFSRCEIINCHKILNVDNYHSVCEFCDCNIVNDKKIVFDNISTSYLIVSSEPVKLENCKIMSLFDSVKMMHLFVANQEKIESDEIDIKLLLPTDVYFGDCKIEADNSIFQGIIFTDSSFQFINCKFLNCFGDIKFVGQYDEDSRNFIKNSIFENCTVDIDGSSGFVKVADETIFKNTYVTFSYTEFSHCKFCDYTEMITEKEKKGSLLRMERVFLSAGTNNKMNFCTFENINMVDSYLINGERPYKTHDIVEFNNCDFRKCTTKRSDHILITTKGHYEEKGWLGDKNKLYTSVVLNNCTGLK